MQEFWDERFDTEEYVYGKHPNRFFKWFIDNTFQKGSILLPADGEGRNSVYAALKGWDVTAFDFSEEAKRKALDLAEEYNTNIHYKISSIEDFHTDEKFDAIALVYLHLPSNTRREMHHKLINFLKPGGYFVMEAFSKKQIEYNTGGPRNIDMLYDGQKIMEDLNVLELVHYKEKLKEVNEGHFHSGKAEVIQLISRKLN
jgi:2-polyprenyl-3-methyl-5-hydroxy-6-metoxy-1,4-benzoquinol methylase